MNGERQVEYSWRLVESDPQPQGRKKELSLREKEALTEQDRYDMISISYGSMMVNELFDFYVRMKQKRREMWISERNLSKSTISYCMNWMKRESADFKSALQRQSRASEKFR